MRTVLLATIVAALGACRSPEPRAPHAHASPTPAGDARLEAVARIHGAPGPFAVAGYRIGERALRELGADAGGFSLEVVHESPDQVQWSCIADGVQAATGVSVGKLTLRHRTVEAGATRTLVTHRKTGATIAFRLTPAFLAQHLDLPPEQARAAGAAVIELPDDAIFTVEPVAAP